MQRLAGRSSLAGSGGIPAVTVTDEAEAGVAGDERRLLVRFGEPVQHRVRSGRGARQIEVVLVGRGAALGAATAPAAAAPARAPSAAPPAAADSAATASRSTRPRANRLSVPIPAALQHLNVFTTRRVEQGRVTVETHIGPFATRSEAEFVLSVHGCALPKGARDIAFGRGAGAEAAVPSTTYVIPSAPSTEPLRPKACRGPSHHRLWPHRHPRLP
ncbi:MAG: hypothetical protein U1F49_01185 [Rubrivivax sp.]